MTSSEGTSGASPESRTAPLPTAEEIAELRELAEAATKGPWTIGPTHKDEANRYWVENHTGNHIIARGWEADGGVIGQDNAALIVAMRNRLDSLLAAAERARELEALLRKLRAVTPRCPNEPCECGQDAAIDAVDRFLAEPAKCGTEGSPAATPQDNNQGDAL